MSEYDRAISFVLISDKGVKADLAVLFGGLVLRSQGDIAGLERSSAECPRSEDITGGEEGGSWEKSNGAGDEVPMEEGLKS